MRTLVTGGGGFLGQRLVQLVVEGGGTVSVLSRHRHPEVEGLPDVSGIRADLRDRDSMVRAFEGHDIVFHLAALAAPWGKRADFEAINVAGTANVIDACRRAGISSLVYCSTPSVIGYMTDVHNGGQDIPYATHFVSLYQETKARAEQLVLAANDERLATVALRPHAVIGPGDNNLVPRIIAKAKAGQLPQIGSESTMVDLTFVDNAAWAHLDAAQALADPNSKCAGRAYFITNSEPVEIWRWIRELLGELGIPGPHRHLSTETALRAARIAEFGWRALRLPGEPPITQLQVVGLGRTHTFDISPAQRDLGYGVRVPLAEGKRQLLDWLRPDFE